MIQFRMCSMCLCSAVLLQFGCSASNGVRGHKDGHLEAQQLSDTIPKGHAFDSSYFAEAEQVQTAYDITLKPGDDLPAIFRSLKAEGKVQRIRFTPGEYHLRDTLHLPRTGGLVIIDGQGAVIKAAGSFPVFYSLPANQSEAMVFNKTRYLLENFSQIMGGQRGVFLGSSFNTVVRNVEFIGQEVAAVDLVFCLMCTLENILVTNVLHDGIVLRTAVDGDSKAQVWPGTSFNNSQCNHTVLRSCRVYNRKGATGTSFKVLQSTGVRLLDCISEGWENERAVFFDAQGCTTAKFFAIQNFHLEHAPREGGFVFRSFGTTVEVDGFFTQVATKASPTIWLMNNGNYVFKNIPWWPELAWVKSSHSPSVVIQHCTKGFYDINKNWINAERPGQPIYPEYFRASADLVR